MTQTFADWFVRAKPETADWTETASTMFVTVTVNVLVADWPKDAGGAEDDALMSARTCTFAGDADDGTVAL